MHSDVLARSYMYPCNIVLPVSIGLGLCYKFVVYVTILQQSLEDTVPGEICEIFSYLNYG